MRKANARQHFAPHFATTSFLQSDLLTLERQSTNEFQCARIIILDKAVAKLYSLAATFLHAALLQSLALASCFLCVSPGGFVPQFPGEAAPWHKALWQTSMKMAAKQNSKASPPQHCAWNDYSGAPGPAQGQKFGGTCSRSNVRPCIISDNMYTFCTY